MRKSYYILVTVFIFLLFVAFLVWKSIQNSNHKNQTSRIEKHVQLPKEVTITLDKKGFSPSVMTIKIGSAVRWKNVSGDKQTVNSDDYPNNQLHRELNFGVFNNDSTVVYTFTKPGTYGYHNQFKPEQKGEIVVMK